MAVNRTATDGAAPESATEELHVTGVRSPISDDPRRAGLLEREPRHQGGTLASVAHAGLAHPSVLAPAGSALSNVTAEGYPSRRFRPCAAHFDAIERLAVERAKAAIDARHSNVHPHSCSSANPVVLSSPVQPGGTILGMGSGGHLTHDLDHCADLVDRVPRVTTPDGGTGYLVRKEVQEGATRLCELFPVPAHPTEHRR